MICPDCEADYATPPCACGYGTPITPETANPLARFPRTYESLPFGITKEEFGIALYDTIKLIGGILAIDEHRAIVIYKNQGYQLQALVARRRTIQQELAVQLPRLSESELDQVLQKYPWVVQA